MPKITTFLGVDQMRFILRFKTAKTTKGFEVGPEDRATYKAFREHVASCQPWLVPHAKNWKTKGSMSISSHPLQGGSKLIVGYGWNSRAGHYFGTAQFNPSKLTVTGATELLGLFAGLCEEGYGEFIGRAHCSYIEVFLDAEGARWGSYLYFDSRLRVLDQTYETAGTLYIGAGNRKIAVYDKAKERAARSKSPVTGDLLRIEARLRTDTPFPLLTKLPNAFESLHVIDIARLDAGPCGLTVRAFRRRILEDGLSAQAAFILSPYKKELLEKLKAFTPDWFDPTKAWTLFPDAMQRVACAGLHQHAQLKAPDTVSGNAANMAAVVQSIAA